MERYKTIDGQKIRSNTFTRSKLSQRSELVRPRELPLTNKEFKAFIFFQCTMKQC